MAALTENSVGLAISRFTGLPSTSAAVIRAVSRLSLNPRDFRAGDDLSQNSYFRQLVIAAGGDDLLREMDPARRHALELERMQNANITSAEGRGFLHRAGFDHSVPLAWQDSGGGEGGNGAKYDGLSTSNWSSPAGLAQMRAHAMRHGLGWAAGHHDILRLGPAAIETLAQVNFQRESFHRLTREAGFTAREVVGLARYARDHNVDANRLANVTADSVRVFGGDNPQERERWRNLFNQYYADPNNGQARQQLNEALTQQETRGPQQREQAQRTRDLIRLEGEARRNADNRLVNASTQEVRVQANGSRLISLMGEDEAPPGPGTPRPLSPHVAGPR